MSTAPRPPATPPAAAEILMTAAQVASALGVTTRQIHLMLSAGKYPPCDVRIGRLIRWKVSTHNFWIASQGGSKG